MNEKTDEDTNENRNDNQSNKLEPDVVIKEKNKETDFAVNSTNTPYLKIPKQAKNIILKKVDNIRGVKCEEARVVDDEENDEIKVTYVFDKNDLKTKDRWK